MEEARKLKPDVKFEFVKEEDEWAAIARYNKYLFEKREQERIENNNNTKNQLYKDLLE